METISNKTRLFARRFALFAALVGLCFSSGEGIRLLPFAAAPAAPARPLKDGFSRHGENVINYSFAVHNSAAKSRKVNFQPQKKLDLCETEIFRFVRRPLARRAVRVEDRAAPNSLTMRTRASAPQSDRAPPLI